MRVDSTTSVLHGISCDEVQMPTPNGPAVISIPGKFRGRPGSLALDNNILSKGILAIGPAGYAKTNLICHMVKQIIDNLSNDDVCIIFDAKGDYYSRFFRKGHYVLGSSPEYRDHSLRWNLFREGQINGSSLSDFKTEIFEIASRLFYDQIMGNSTNKFFPQTARNLFAEAADAMILESKKDPSGVMLTNFDLIDFLSHATDQELVSLLTKYPDLSKSAVSISRDSAQTQGIRSELNAALDSMFIDIYSEPGLFSIREFVKQAGAKVLFIEYDINHGSSLEPIYSVLIDLALKEALGGRSHRGKKYIVLDELKLAPHLQHLEDALNVGRSLSLKVICGLQSYNQIVDAYGENTAKSILGGFQTVFCFGGNDVETRKYIKDLSGENLCLEEYYDLAGKPTSFCRAGTTVEDWNLFSLQTGEAYVKTPRCYPFKFYVDEFH